MFEFLIGHVWLIRSICILVLLVSGGWIWLNIHRGLPALNFFLNLGKRRAIVTIDGKEESWEVLSSEIFYIDGPEGSSVALNIEMRTQTAAKRVFTLCYSEEIPNAVYVYYEGGELGALHDSLAFAWKRIFFFASDNWYGNIYFY